MKKILKNGFFMAAACTLAACNGSGGGGSSAPQSPTVAGGDTIVRINSGATTLGPAAFGTNPLVIAKGTRVTWDNQDSVPHSVTAKDGSWDSGTLNAGEGAYSHVFTATGNYLYYSSKDGEQTMSGEIQVTE